MIVTSTKMQGNEILKSIYHHVQRGCAVLLPWLGLALLWNKAVLPQHLLKYMNANLTVKAIATGPTPAWHSYWGGSEMLRLSWPHHGSSTPLQLSSRLWVSHDVTTTSQCQDCDEVVEIVVTPLKHRLHSINVTTPFRLWRRNGVASTLEWPFTCLAAWSSMVGAVPLNLT